MYIAAYVIHNRPQMHTNDWKAFYHHLQAPYGVYHVISAKTTIQFHAKYHISGSLSAQNILGCATRRDTHCCSSVPKPALDI